MTRVLFLNPVQPRCGVHQYGVRLFNILKLSPDLDCTYKLCPDSIDIGSLYFYDVVIYNVHPGIGNAMHNAPFPCSVKQVAIYHDGHMKPGFDRWIFSDSSAPGYGDLTTIGRPLPEFNGNVPTNSAEHPVIGLSGLVGAWAVDMVKFVRSAMPEAKIRLHLAPSDHCDPTGALARAVGDSCLHLGNSGMIEVDYEFKPENQVLSWLSENDLNCYIRSTGGGPMSISSALDMALAVGRPIAVNANPMFRHLTRVCPEIMVEHTPLREILSMGTRPLEGHYRRNRRPAVMQELETLIREVCYQDKPIIENRGQ